MKKLLTVFMAVMALSVNAFAATEVNVVVDKTPVEQKGVIVDNRTLVPVRGVFEKWDILLNMMLKQKLQLSKG